jgi:carboxypeptidase family protein
VLLCGRRRHPLSVVRTSALAQGGRAELQGVVLDQGKAVLPGVTVTVTHEGTGQTRHAVTGPDGQFVIPTLLPGTYTVKADLQGFEPAVRTGLALSVGQEVSVTLTLSLAGVKEEVTVTAQSPVVETTSSNRVIRSTRRPDRIRTATARTTIGRPKA